MMMELNAPNEKPAKLRRPHHRHRAIGREEGKEGASKNRFAFQRLVEGRAIKGRSPNARLG